MQATDKYSALQARFATSTLDNNHPRKALAILAEGPYLTPAAPRQFGGAGESYLELASLCEALGAVDTAARTIVTIQSAIAAAILRWGTDEQKRRYVPPLARGDLLGAIAFSEEGAGSDLSLVSSALNVERSTLSGQKTWVSMGVDADLALVLTRVEGGFSCWLVRLGPGVERIAKYSDGMSHCGLADLRFDPSVPTRHELLGPHGLALATVVQTTLDVGRLCIAAGSAGIVRTTLELGVERANDRAQGSSFLADHQITRQRIATIAVALETSEALVYRAAAAFAQADSDHRRLTWIAKYAAAAAADKSARDVADMFGASGISSESKITALRHDAWLMTLIEGAPSLSEDVIGQMTLGKMK